MHLTYADLCGMEVWKLIGAICVTTSDVCYNYGGDIALMFAILPPTGFLGYETAVWRKK